MRAMIWVVIGVLVAGPVRADDELAKVKQALAKKVDIDWRERPLREVLVELCRGAGLGVTLDRHALKAIGDRKLTLRRQGASAGEVLAALLEKEGLAYVVKQGALLISTPDSELIQGPPRVRIYNVRDALRDAVLAAVRALDGRGTIREQNGMLIIRAPALAHADVAKALSALRDRLLKLRKAPERREPAK